MRRWHKVLLIILSSVAGLVLAGVLYVMFAPQFGAKPTGERLIRMQGSENHKDGKFVNPIETPVMMSFGTTVKSTIDFFKGGSGRVPESPLLTESVSPAQLTGLAADRVRVTWLGHSTVLIQIDGKLLLTDPVFSERSSPISFVGPKRFFEKNPIEISDLPALDAVVISHDHFDHLDHQAIALLKDKTERFFAPLGVGAHLEHWGVPADKIIELDWWEAAQYAGLKLTATPARHFSGRAGADTNRTLWAAWAIEADDRRVFFGGDSGYFDGFAEIGRRLGPFDLTLLECGAYSPYWPLVHMMPEQTAQAHLDLGGRVLMPIHWGKYNLSLHAWTEPVERLVRQAEKLDVELATPGLGGSFELGQALPQSAWWKGEAQVKSAQSENMDKVSSTTPTPGDL